MQKSPQQNSPKRDSSSGSGSFSDTSNATTSESALSTMGFAKPVLDAISLFYAEKERKIEQSIQQTIRGSVQIGLTRIKEPEWSHCANTLCSPLLACAAIPPRTGNIDSITLQRRSLKVIYSDKSVHRVRYRPEFKELLSTIEDHLQDSKVFQLSKSSHIARVLSQRGLLLPSKAASTVIEATRKVAVNPAEILSFHSPDTAFILLEKNDAIAINSDGTKLWREQYTDSFRQKLTEALSIDPPPDVYDRYHTVFGLPTGVSFNSYARQINSEIADLYAHGLMEHLPVSATSIINRTFGLIPSLHTTAPGNQFVEVTMDELPGVVAALALGMHTVNRLATRFAKTADLSHLYERDDHGRRSKEINPFINQILDERLTRLMNPFATSRFGLPGHNTDTLVFDLPLLEGLKIDSNKYSKLALATFASNVFWTSDELWDKFYPSIPGVKTTPLGKLPAQDLSKVKPPLHRAFIAATLEYELTFQGMPSRTLNREMVEALEAIYKVPKKESIIESFPESRLGLSNAENASKRLPPNSSTP